MWSFCISGVEHNGVNITAAVCKCREDKTGIRYANDPVTDTWTNAVIISKVTKPWFGKIYRTDGTEQILVYFFGLIKFIVVRSLCNNVIDIMKN